MTIHITCECGKQLHAPDEFAGRQTRCPACQQAVTLPTPQAIQAAPTPPPPATAFPETSTSQPPPIEAPAGGPVVTSKLALWSLILGIASRVLLVPAIVLGILGLRAIGRDRQALGGTGLAVTGLVIGALSSLVWVVLVPLIAVLLLPAVQNARMAAARIQSSNNLRQIGLACHMYHDSFNCFPSENLQAGMPNSSKLSWRVQILPFLDEADAALYKEFHLDEPWDSEHNKKLLPRMPKIYLNPHWQTESDRSKGMTYYRGFVCPGGVFAGDPALRTGLNVIAITNANGSSNTALVVEAKDPVPWTKPEDPDFNENGPFGSGAKTFVILFADGHVQSVPRNFDRETMRRIINWQNTKPVNLP